MDRKIQILILIHTESYFRAQFVILSSYCLMKQVTICRAKLPQLIKSELVASHVTKFIFKEAKSR